MNEAHIPLQNSVQWIGMELFLLYSSAGVVAPEYRSPDRGAVIDLRVLPDSGNPAIRE